MWSMGEEARVGLSAAAQWIWAKSRMDERGRLTGWLPLHEHLADSADAAELLWDQWLGAQRTGVVAAGVGDAEQARRLAIFLAGVHDVGKATPPFAVKVPVLGEQMRYHGFPFAFRPTPEDQRRLPHGLAGQVILERYLERQGWTIFAASQLGSVVGGHHGLPPGLTELQSARAREDLLGSDVWRGAQDELLDVALRRSGLDLEFVRERGIGTPALVLLTGIVIVADWLASNDKLFPLVVPESQLRSRRGRAQRAWERIDLPEPWTALDEGAAVDDLMAARFDITAGARPVQAAAVALARRCDLPGIMVIEAPMGEGKTEAALLAAEILAARSGASGIVNALPTQATTNAMFARVLTWLGSVPDATVSDSARRRHATVLAHGKASLDATFRRLQTQSRASGIGIDEGLQSVDHARRQTGESIDAYVHDWMTSRKKTPLADFMVATIDQVLFLALQARHLALRHLGLAGKVVIIDEVHAYDAYMSVYLHRALEWLGAYGCPVVLLSATLPSDARTRLVAAYQAGAAAMLSAESSSDAEDDMFPDWTSFFAEDTASPSAEPVSSEEPSYPVVWTLSQGEAVAEEVSASARGAVVEIELAADDLGSLDEILGDALVDEGCVLVIRNTVKRAQETYQHLAEQFGEDDVTLAHSRFMACDRAALDAGLVSAFGPPSAGPEGNGRPRRHVVVATQVVEQSLDVDFDVLVTDLAPIDLVLQRIGRMHRHPRERPPRLRVPRCVVVGVDDWSAAPPVPDGGSQRVYGGFALLQSAALLVKRSEGSGVVAIPEDIAPWVEAAYGATDLGRESWGGAIGDARKEHEARIIKKETAAKSFRLRQPIAGVESLADWLGRSAGDVDESAKGSAQVRDSEDSIEVLLLARDPDGVVRVPSWIDDDYRGQPVPLDFEPDASVTVVIASCSLRLPTAESRGRRGDVVIDALSREWYFEAWQRSPQLRGQLIMVLDEQPDGSLAGVVGGRRFTYDQRHGLKVVA